jgi:hypothetical protein
MHLDLRAVPSSLTNSIFKAYLPETLPLWTTSVQHSACMVSEASSPAQPKMICEPPPGGASTREEERPVMKLPTCSREGGGGAACVGVGACR